MTSTKTQALVIGATSGIGEELARYLASRGERVTVTSRDAGRATKAAQALGSGHRGIALDLAKPAGIAAQLADIDTVHHLALVASERDRNSLADYDIAAASGALTAKLIGYTAVISALLPRFAENAAIVVLGGCARKASYPGSTSTGLQNGAVSAMVRTYARDLAPVRINGLHPGGVIDSPAWVGAPDTFVEAIRARTSSGRLVRMRDVAHAAGFLFDNRGVNGTNLDVDGGFPSF